MKTNQRITGIGLLIIICGCCSCKVTNKYSGTHVSSVATYRGANQPDANSIGILSWKKVFTDPLLQQLIQHAIDSNLNLQSAYSRIRQASLVAAQSRLAFYPAINGSISTGFSGLSNQLKNGRTITPRQYEAVATASWEADIWNKLGSTRNANNALFKQSASDALAIQTAVVADVALAYYQLQALDQQIIITRQSAASWQQTVDVMKELKQADVVTEAAIVQSDANKYAVELSIPDLKLSTWQTENQIQTLLGKSADSIQRLPIEVAISDSLLRAGIPAQLLANRPDVRSAEYNYRYYFELTNVARASLYPTLQFDLSGGFSSYGSLIHAGSWLGSITAGLTQPVFNRGINRTRLANAVEQQSQAKIAFQQVLLTAGQEVSDALMQYRTAQDKKLARLQQLDDLQKSVSYTQELVRYGFANYTEVLTAQQSLLAAQLAQVNDRLQQLQALVYLYRALGGGWK